MARLQHLTHEEKQASAGVLTHTFDLAAFKYPIVVKSVAVTLRHASTAHGWERVAVHGRIRGLTYFPPVCRGTAISLYTGETERYSCFYWDGYRPINNKSIKELWLCVTTNEDNVIATIDIWIEEGE